MTIRSTQQLALSLTVALVLSACAADATKPHEVAASSPSRSVPPAPRAQTAEATTPQRPATETGVTPGTLRDFELNVGDRVFFAFDKSDLDSSSQATLQKQAAWLSKYRGVTAAIQGNADERGTREYNLALGARRATAVKDYLVSLGVREDRLMTISYGKERPVCAESSEACWSNNRRAASAITNAIPSSSNVAMRN